MSASLRGSGQWAAGLHLGATGTDVCCTFLLLSSAQGLVPLSGRPTSRLTSTSSTRKGEGSGEKGGGQQDEEREEPGLKRPRFRIPGKRSPSFPGWSSAH